jgi:hypothetical protein
MLPLFLNIKLFDKIFTFINNFFKKDPDLIYKRKTVICSLTLKILINERVIMKK